MKQIFAVILVSLGLSACAIVQRHNGDRYGSRSANDQEEVVYDSETNRALSPEEKDRFDEKMLLSRLERAIRTPEERTQYNRYKTTLDSDRERIEFLSLDGSKARERYLQAKGYSTSAARYSREIASVIEQNDIAIGMGRQAVRESWGDPADVEVAGRPELGNERWRYIEYVPTAEGYQEEQRILYFENGKLVGWEKY